MKKTIITLLFNAILLVPVSAVDLEETVRKDVLEQEWVSVIENGLRWAKASPDSSVPHFLLAAAYYFNNEYDRQLREFELAMKNKDAKEKIFRWCKKFAQQNPHNEVPQILLGFIYSLRKEDDNAISCYKKTLELNPRNIYAYSNLGVAQTMKKNYEEALDCFSKVVEINPDYARAYYNMGNIYFCKKEFGKAAEFYEKAIAKNSACAEFYYNLAVAYYYVRGNEARVISNAQRAIKLNPTGAIGRKAREILLKIEKEWQGQSTDEN